MIDNHIYLKSFSIIHRFSFIYHTRMMKKAHISGHQMGYIICVCKQPGISQEGISSALGLDKGAVAKGVRPLIEAGYINRVQSEKDKRAYELYPTKKAKAIQSKAEKINVSLEQILTKGMTEKEQELFKQLLLKACNNVMAAAGEDKRKITNPASAGGHFDHNNCHHHHTKGRF